MAAYFEAKWLRHLHRGGGAVPHDDPYRRNWARGFRKPRPDPAPAAAFARRTG